MSESPTLSSSDALGVRGDDRVDAALALLDGVVAAEARLFAVRMRAVFDAARGASEADRAAGHDLGSLFLPAHLAGTLGVQQVSAQQLVADARHLVLNLPGTLEVLEAGAIPAHIGRVLLEETRQATAAVCAQVEAELLPWLAHRSATEVRRRVRRVLVRLSDQAEAARRRRRAVAERAVSATPLPDGMVGVWAVLPAAAAQVFTTTLQRLAQAATADGSRDERTAAQREADLLAALPGLVLDGLAGELGPSVRDALTEAGFRPVGPDATRIGATVLVPAASALGQSDEPAELLGYGPITAEHARTLLGSASVRAAGVDPSTGRVVSVSTSRLQPAPSAGGWAAAPPETHADPLDDPTVPAWQRWIVQQTRTPPVPPGEEDGYRPSRALRRLVQLRDPQCTGVRCSVPSWRCDLDHRTPWPHGPTAPANLAPLSRRCHRMKQAGWSCTRQGDGSTTWTAPNQRRYVTPAITWPCPPVTLPPGTAA